MSHFLRHSELRHKEQKTEELQVFLAMSIRHRFRDEVVILESEEARQKILEHPKCPFTKFVFWGEPFWTGSDQSHVFTTRTSS